MALIMAGLLALVAVLAGVTVTTANTKTDATWELAERHEPTAADVQRLYRALSEADATAASTFLAAQNASLELRKRYEDDIALAGQTIGLAAVDRGTDPRVAREIDTISRQLPVYAGLVEAARANNLQGLPIGAAYLREASHVMRTQILPAAERLYTIQADRVAEERADAVRFPYLAAGLLLVTLIALVATQVYLWRHFGRRLNLGMVVATAALIVGLLWSSVALTLHATSAADARPDRVTALGQARIVALQARANELLTLVARGNGAQYEEQFDELADELVGKDGKSGLLAKARQDAEGDVAAALANTAGATRSWLEGYREVRKLDNGGRHGEAVERAINEGAAGASAPAFAQLDAGLERALQASREQFVDDIVTAARSLTLLTPGWAVLSVVAAGGIAYGLRERLREYR
ncbi:hypothetical protein [Thermocrispum sp.]|uniref:Secreted protein n=2 Tax=Thermocrispum agreste TaxID=37925 RepID=A0ABD6FHU8_9PSEU|nr:hypothetical protein [Thermocrispum sp.]